MLFHSLQFLLFIVPLLALNVVFTNQLKNLRLRKWLLILSSAAFYMSWNIPLFALLAGSILLNFLVGKQIAASPEQRRLWLVFGVVSQLAILAVFKYANFGIESAVLLLTWLGIPVSGALLDIVLPLGISFYTFQGMSYIIDIYRQRYQPYRSALDYFLYISFFPQLVAGPIVRADYFLKRLEQIDRPITLAMINSGLFLFLSGVFKKAVLADNAAKIANLAFGSPDEISSYMVIAGIYAFAFQIYFDFSGYTDMARGLGRMLGIELPINFDAPYLARGLREFWQRWHISLSTWLRDYLYISLGGSRTTRLKTYRNLLITMILGGLWHGASYNFLVWGGIHGLSLACEHALIGKGKRQTSSMFASAAAIIVTFNLVCLAWVFFRSPDFASASAMLSRLVDPAGYVSFADIGLFRPQNWLFGFIFPAFVVFVWERRRSSNAIGLEMPSPFKRAVEFCSLLFLILLTSGETSEFVYFRF